MTSMFLIHYGATLGRVSSPDKTWWNQAEAGTDLWITEKDNE